MSADFTQLSDAFAEPSRKELREWDIPTSRHYRSNKFHVVFEYVSEACFKTTKRSTAHRRHTLLLSSPIVSLVSSWTTDEDNPGVPSRNTLEQIMKLVAREMSRDTAWYMLSK